MSGRAQLALEGAALTPGESVRLVCPFCGGGSSHERSLVLTLSDDGALLFVCHRAHCNSRGRLGGSLGGFDITRKPSANAPRPFVAEIKAEEILPVPAPVAEAISARWFFDHTPAAWRWSGDKRRLLLPVFSPTRQRRGWVGRAFEGQQYRIAKTLNYKEILDQPWAHWPQVYFQSRVVYVVEDLISAERLCARGQTACALMGTHASGDVVDEILETAARDHAPLHIALDRDALAKSFALKDEGVLRHKWGIAARVLEKDIKDMTHKELNDWLSVGY